MSHSNNVVNQGLVLVSKGYVACSILPHSHSFHNAMVKDIVLVVRQDRVMLTFNVFIRNADTLCDGYAVTSRHV